MNNMQQQTPFEWMKFIPTQGEKHLGIAIIRYERRFIFRFKIMPSDHGGYWATTASIKTGTANGKDKYEAAFSLDSDYEKSQMTDFVLACVENELNKKVETQASVFTQQTQTAKPAQQQQTTFGSGNAAYNSYNQNPADDHIPF